MNKILASLLFFPLAAFAQISEAPPAGEFLVCHIFDSTAKGQCVAEPVVIKEMQEHPDSPSTQPFKSARVSIDDQKLAISLFAELTFGKLTVAIRQQADQMTRFTVGQAGVTYPLEFTSFFKLNAPATEKFGYATCVIRNPREDGGPALCPQNPR